MSIQRKDLHPYFKNLIRFSGKLVLVEGTIKLRVILGTWPSVINMDVDFLVVHIPNITYNTILGRMSLNKVKAIISTPYLLMKFLTPYKVG